MIVYNVLNKHSGATYATIIWLKTLPCAIRFIYCWQQLIFKTMNGANFLRDVVEFMNTRNEHLNQNKTVEQLISDFMNEISPDPNHYDDNGRSCIGYTNALPPNIQEALNSGDGVYRP